MWLVHTANVSPSAVAVKVQLSFLAEILVHCRRFQAKKAKGDLSQKAANNHLDTIRTQHTLFFFVRDVREKNPSDSTHK